MILDQLLGDARCEVGLVEHEQLRHRSGVDLVEHDSHGVDLGLRVRRAGIDDVHEVVGERGDFERALEALDQPVRAGG